MSYSERYVARMKAELKEAEKAGAAGLARKGRAGGAVDLTVMDPAIDGELQRWESNSRTRREATFDAHQSRIGEMLAAMRLEKQAAAELKDGDTVIYNTQHRSDRAPWVKDLQVVED